MVLILLVIGANIGYKPDMRTYDKGRNYARKSLILRSKEDRHYHSVFYWIWRVIFLCFMHVYYDIITHLAHGLSFHCSVISIIFVCSIQNYNEISFLPNLGALLS